MELDIKVENYLKKRFGPATRLKDMKPLGEGVHGAAYLLKFSSGHEEKCLTVSVFAGRMISSAPFSSSLLHDAKNKTSKAMKQINTGKIQLKKRRYGSLFLMP